VLKDARNEAEHHFERRVLGGTEQYLPAESAYWAYVVCLLRLMPVPDAVFDHIEQHQGFRWLQRQLKPLLT
jgi:hypothetical protein